MNLIWLILLFVTILYCLFTGNVSIVNDVFLNVGEETFDFIIPLLCVMVFWNGILYIAREAGIIRMIEKVFHPLLKKLFPDIAHDEETLGYVATNIVV
ncbi:MAG: spore maturation protein A, partial [Longicatena sp.]